MNFGRVGFVMEGDWSAAVTYDTLSVVLYEGAVYAAKRMSAGSEPSTHPADWLKWVESPIISAEQTENGYDLTISNGDGITSVVHLLNGQITEAELTTALSGLREAFNANIAEEYSSSSVYSEGDYCLYNNVLYRCKTDILSPEAWDSTHWEAASLADDVQDLSETLYNNKVDAITSTVSGEIVTIDDGGDDLFVKKLAVSLLPVQDLHGYDNPWPAGGGTNLLDPNLKFAAGTYYGGAVLSTDDGYNLTLSGTPTESGNITTNTIATSDAVVMKAGTYTSTGAIFSTYKPDGSWYTNRQVGTWTADSDFIVRSAYIQAVAGGTISGTRFISLVKGSTAPSAWSPYSNICTISGWTGTEVTQTNANLLGGIELANNLKSSCATANIDTTNKTVSFSYNAQFTGGFFQIPYKANTQYTFMLMMKNETISRSNMIVRYSDGSYSGIQCPTANTKGLIVFTSTAGKTVIGLEKSANGGTTILYYDECGIFEGVLTADDFKPYNGNTYPIDWTDEAGTVYGGNIDPVSGVLTVNRLLDTITKDSAWYGFNTGTGNSSAVVQLSDYLNVKYVDGSSSRNGAISSTGKEAQNYWIIARQDEVPSDGDMCFAYSSTGQLRFHRLDVTNITDLASFKANFPDTQVCYQLKNPVIYQLTPEQISTFLGVNNFWSNGNGQIDLEYRADTKLYIEQLTKPAEDDMTANANIASGKFFMVGNRLMLSTTAIAQGEQIVVGTNCTEVSLADALNTINA